nr:SigB/SigF/SigG family RNA polymerase sigma factor [Mycolicibacterium sp. GF69]
MCVIMASLPQGSAEFERQRERIIVRCLPLADHIAYRFARRGESVDDLVQVARVGLVNAVNRFDPAKASSFLAFAVPTMLGEVKRHFRDHGWTMHVPRRLKDLTVAINRAIPELTHTLHRAPTPSELAGHLHVSREDIIETLTANNAYNVRSLDTPLAGDEPASQTWGDRLGAEDHHFDYITDLESLRPLLAQLSPRDRTIVELRFGRSLTQTQIADHIGVSQMHVSRMLHRILGELREGLHAD